MPGRTNNSDQYRYGFNGMEKNQDGELGSITTHTTEFRQYNSAIGRWLSVDPKPRDFESPYVFSGNSPISFSDPFGDTLRIQTSYGDLNDGSKSGIVNEIGEVIAGNGFKSVVYTPGMEVTGKSEWIDATINSLNYIYENNLSEGGLEEIINSSETSHIIGFRTTKHGGALNRFYADTNTKGKGGSYLMFDHKSGLSFHTTNPDPGGWKAAYFDWMRGLWGYRSPLEGLNHELEHVRSFLNDRNQHYRDSKNHVADFDNKEEHEAILLENKAAIKIYGKDAVSRNHHRGNFTGAKNGVYPTNVKKKN